MSNMNFATNLLPDESGSRDLGSSTKKWNVYADGGNVLTDSDVVDNLTTGGTTVPLSAEMGKYLASIHSKNLDVMDVDLGTSLTEAQATAISNGTFEGLHVDAHWTIGGHVWRIWGFNPFKNKGDTPITKNHCLVMPDDNLLNADGSTTRYMNDTNTTDGGYTGTKLRTTYVPQMLSTIQSCFGSSHVLSHRELLCNAVSNGKASGWSWCDCTVEIPSELMMYGAPVWANYTDGGAGYNVGMAYPILPLAIIKPERVINRENYWLRDVVSASLFTAVAYNGGADRGYASDALFCVRPFFLLS